MKLQLNGFKVSLENTKPLKNLVAKALELPPESIEELRILRESVDARKKHALALVYNLSLEINASEKQIGRALKANPGLQKPKTLTPPSLTKGQSNLRNRPIVVGAGPGGYFAALTLAAHGYSPLLIERGDDVDTRTQKVTDFWHGGELDPESNVQFGEGGAGTFSDGKLTTRIDDPRINFVLDMFVRHGAPEEILFKHRPHVGTDKLRTVVKGLRAKLIAEGGEVRFRTKLTGLKLESGKVAGIVVNGKEEIPAEVVILAIGHSSRDTYEMLKNLDVSLEAKPFAIGLRVEHPQPVIDRAQYGNYAGHPKLGSADYHITYQDNETGRGAYSFCMCPGGKVVAATSEKGQVVTNGMSEYARDTGKANSALVVTVRQEDFPTPDPLGAVEFQRMWEKRAFKLGGEDYRAPVQNIRDFVNDTLTVGVDLEGSYLPGVEKANLRDALPKEVGEVLARAIEHFDKRIMDFANNATLTGVETRTSAPLRILRDNFQAVGLKGLYPCGEGAGYAGGIMSSAVDGIRVAEGVITDYAPLERRK